jgi:hypothetical protein
MSGVWRHELHVRKTKNTFKAYCTCGWQSAKNKTADEAVADYRAHTKLVEREGRKASEGA